MSINAHFDLFFILHERIFSVEWLLPTKFPPRHLDNSSVLVNVVLLYHVILSVTYPGHRWFLLTRQLATQHQGWVFNILLSIKALITVWIWLKKGLSVSFLHAAISFKTWNLLPFCHIKNTSYFKQRLTSLHWATADISFQKVNQTKSCKY